MLPTNLYPSFRGFFDGIYVLCTILAIKGELLTSPQVNYILSLKFYSLGFFCRYIFLYETITGCTFDIPDTELTIFLHCWVIHYLDSQIWCLSCLVSIRRRISQNVKSALVPLFRWRCSMRDNFCKSLEGLMVATRMISQS